MLEEKHIKSYPLCEKSGLLVQTNTRTASSKGQPLGYKIGRAIGYSSRTGVEVIFDPADFAEDYDLDEIKLILRPFSDIISEIEVNGESFIPLLELAKMHGFNPTNYTIEEENGTFVLYEKTISHPFGKVYSRSFFEIDSEDFDIDFGTQILKGGELEEIFFPIKNQISIQDKLKEWGFDIYKLIEQKLAININEVELLQIINELEK